MAITHRLEQALQRMNELMGQGHYFNPAIGQVCTQYGLNETEYNTIVHLYDAQGCPLVKDKIGG